MPEGYRNSSTGIKSVELIYKCEIVVGIMFHVYAVNTVGWMWVLEIVQQI